jgi:outer membrane protein OmpA-like peptidoglycan-associated protein
VHTLALTAAVVFLVPCMLLSQQNRPESSTSDRSNSESAAFAHPQSFGLGVFLGADQLNSDLMSGNTFPDPKYPWKFSASVVAQYSLGSLGNSVRFHALGEAGYRGLEASGGYKGKTDNYFYQIKNDVIDIALGLKAEFLPASAVRPFLFAGIGYMMFNPTRTTGTATVPLELSDNFGLDKGSLALPVGGGVAFAIGRNVDLALRFHKTFSTSDNLDGWTSNLDDNYPVFSVGFTYFFGEGKAEEIAEVKAPVAPSPKDTDGDGLIDEDESKIYRTDPNLKDTDGDGLTDGDEVKIYHTDPLNKDTDGDGLTDGDEIQKYHTDPLNKDTDGDGLNDGEEVTQYKTNPLKTDTDGDGLSDYDEVKIYRTNPLMKDTDSDGDDDGREVKNGTDPLKADVLKVEQGTPIVLEGVNFETNKYVILPSSEDVLMKAYNTLRTHPEIKLIEISGHTDDVGNATQNMTLSKNRAKAVKDWLVQKGIDGNRINTVGFGKTKPSVPNTSPENRFKNRRIEFNILQMQK